MDLVTALLIIIAVILVADLLVAGGAMTMSSISAMAGAVAHPLVAGLLIGLIVVILILGGLT